jgi:hypothetical protein
LDAWVKQGGAATELLNGETKRGSADGANVAPGRVKAQAS